MTKKPKQTRPGPGRPARPGPQEINLVSTWRSAMTQDATSLTEALESMNKTLGMSITHSRIAEWEKEERMPSQAVIAHMLQTVLPDLLIKAGLDEPNAHALMERVRIPVVLNN